MWKIKQVVEREGERERGIDFDRDRERGWLNC